MPRVLVVDWLGRGGIAHTTEAWLRALADGAPVLVTRAGRELALAHPDAVVAGAGGPLRSHLAVVRAAVRTIGQLRPDVVVLQGSVLPRAELPVVAAARRAGARLVLVAHEERPARAVPGGGSVADLAGRADLVVTHSSFVAERIERRRRPDDVLVLPLPLPVGLLEDRGGRSLADASSKLAVHFGNLHRRYKGTSVVIELAAAGVAGWTFAFVGVGAPREVPGATTVPGFVAARDLVATVAASRATVLPYRRSAQSAAVVLAQALGSVAVASDVGGIGEQIVHSATGMLIAPGAPSSAWADALRELDDDGAREAMADAARDAVQRGHDRFCSEVRAIAGSS